MSFYRITDPKKRDAMVADYIATVKRIKQRHLDARLGDLAHQTELGETLDPIIESNTKTSTAITKELKPMKEEIIKLNKHMSERLPAFRGGKRKTDETKLLEGDHSRTDMYFGIQRDKDNNLIIGNKKIEIDEDRNIYIDGNMYKATPGLWSLVMDISPKNYTKEDWETYKKLAIQTDLINNPLDVKPNSRPKLTNKYKHYLTKIEEERQRMKEGDISEEEDGEQDQPTKKFDTKEDDAHGSGIQFLPNTIKDLFDKLKLLVAEFIAGNTTTRNELVAVLDQLRKRKQLSEKDYTTINTLLSQ